MQTANIIKKIEQIEKHVDILNQQNELLSKVVGFKDAYIYIPKLNIFYCVRCVNVKKINGDMLNYQYTLNGYGFTYDEYGFRLTKKPLIIDELDELIFVSKDTFYIEMNSRYKQFLRDL